MLGSKSRAGTRQIKAYIILNGNFLCLPCPSTNFFSPVWRFYATWMASWKGSIEWICGLTEGNMSHPKMLCTVQNSQHSNCNLWVIVYRHKTDMFYTIVSQRESIISFLQAIMEDQVYSLWFISSLVMKLLFETRDIWVPLYYYAKVLYNRIYSV